MALGKIILIVLGILVGTAILGYMVSWFLLQFQKFKLKGLAEKEWRRINNIPEQEEKSWLNRMFSFNNGTRKTENISRITGREPPTESTGNDKTA